MLQIPAQNHVFIVFDFKANLTPKSDQRFAIADQLQDAKGLRTP